MKMIMTSTDNYEKLLKAKEESETKIESYKQCVAGYESRIKELTEELDKLKDQYRGAVAKKVLNGIYGAEQDICCRISKTLNASMFDKITELSDENVKIKDEIKELKYRIGLFETELLTKNASLGKLAKENEELKDKVQSLKCDNGMFKEELLNAKAENEKLKTELKELKNSTVSFDCHEWLIEANEKLAAENNRLTNNVYTTDLETELRLIKKQYMDLNNAYKSQKNELSNRKKLLKDVALELNNIYEHMKTEASPFEMLTIDLRKYII